MTKVPITVRNKAEILGDEGIRWLSNLNNIIKELEHDWKIIVGNSLEGGSEAFVSEAIMEDGTEAVLKISLPELNGNAVFANEVKTLQIAKGRGYAQLFNYKLSKRAMLLEKLGAPLKNSGYTIEKQIEITCATLEKSWIQVPNDLNLQYGNHLIEWFSTFITELWEDLHKSCPKHIIDKALAFLKKRAADFYPETSVLVHGDAHNGNIMQDLSNSPTAFKLIDPDGLVAEPAYDLGVLMREWVDELLPNPLTLGQERCSLLNQLTGISPQPIWEWGFIQCVSTGLFLIQSKQEHLGNQMLKIAESWAKA